MVKEKSMKIKKGTRIKLKCNLRESYGEIVYDKGSIVKISYVATDNRGNPVGYGVGGFEIPRHEFTVIKKKK